VLGDLIEINALQATLGADRTRDDRCLVGSVKPNIGHLEAAAGVASLIKALLIVREGWIPRTLYCEPANPDLPVHRGPLQIASRSQAWSHKSGRRRAGVSSLSFGGANAHIIVEEPPDAMSVARQTAAGLAVLPVSARSPSALLELVQRYADYCAGLVRDPHGREYFAAACLTAGIGRKHFLYRCAVVADGPEQAARELADFTKRDPTLLSAIRPRPSPVLELVCGSGPTFEEALETVLQLQRCGLHPDLISGSDEPGTRAAGMLATHPLVRTRRIARKSGTATAARCILTFGDVPPETARGATHSARVLGPHPTCSAAALAAAYLAGITPDWRNLSTQPVRVSGLPTYPFQRRCHWRTLGAPVTAEVG
jgi:acyl transferase domain-containing protein